MLVPVSCHLRILLARLNLERAKQGQPAVSLRRLARESRVSQSALSLSVFVGQCTDREMGKHYEVAMANPEIIKAEGEQRGIDGCLSIPGYYGVNVRRAAHVVVKGQDMRGKPMRVSAEGLFAWALQHEIDHLDGILYLDRLDRPEDLREIR